MASTLALNTQSIELTEVEKTLRQLLLDVAEFVDSPSAAEDPESQAKLPDQLAREKVVLRFTGGWVRDKLLGVGSHDIDVAINKMTGFQFGLKLKEYLEIPGNPEKYGLEGVASPDDKAADAGTTSKSRKVGGLYKIEANPEKSKHLETVTTKILGLDIDLVNLRKETYTEDSRNPQMEFGTPEEDALRRDATVNALFYNLNTSTIEDFTGRGFEDMQKRIIRTPLEPYQTFMDDPLRVLRLIRFASRLGYTIDPAAEECMRNAEINEALRIKISRERVGIELEKMLKGPDPRSALNYINRLDLYETIFTDPTKKVTFTPETAHLQPAYEVVSKIAASMDVPSDLAEIYASIRSVVLQGEEDQYHAWILAALVPWADAPQPEPKKAGGKIPPPLAENVVREGIKAPNKVCEVVAASVRNLDDIRKTVDKFNDHNRHLRKRSEAEDWTARDTLGMAIRRWGATWRSQVVFALAYEVANVQSSEKTIVESYRSFLQHIQALDLLEAHTFTPMIDGRALSAALSTPPANG
ncbi:CCA tRNA nucleotidyltransferase, mitochondrial [Coniosporium tulheliwenetii]|uniref:CCA tRNA nucleotidyltransferase, mitochondrial n=1 Tax=Coniosporium tulheliwenetii TaxID=3383036 RepID=A0ACC2ZB41_9PEZI|nr:CCA tRNA nucleotidyltransferase, mitochondrial [Cladosporium sp. JES 115]